MQNAYGTTQEFGAPTQGGFNNGGQGGNNGQRPSYPTPLSIQSRPQNTTPESLHASLVGRIYNPKVEMRQNSNGQMVKVFSCNVMTVKQASTFNYHFGPYGTDGKIMPIFPVDQETIYVSVSLWESPNRQTVTNYIEKLNLKDGDQVFVGGTLKCGTSNNPQYAGRCFLNLSAKDFTLIRRSQANSQGDGQMNGGQGNYNGQSNGGYNANQPYNNQQFNQVPANNTNAYVQQGNQAFNGGQMNVQTPQTQVPQAPMMGNPYGEQPGAFGQDPASAGINISDDDLPF